MNDKDSFSPFEPSGNSFTLPCYQSNSDWAIIEETSSKMQNGSVPNGVVANGNGGNNNNGSSTGAPMVNGNSQTGNLTNGLVNGIHENKDIVKEPAKAKG